MIIMYGSDDDNDEYCELMIMVLLYGGDDSDDTVYICCQ